jgi:Protein of unknown function (DUF1553)
VAHALAYHVRLWKAYFGIEIVSTSEDLGTQSETLSHPELLDWLAFEFMDCGWDMKAMLASSSAMGRKHP